MIREKAHRLPKICYQGEVTVSFTMRLDRRATAFTKPVVVEAFLETLAHAAERRACMVAVYCFMPDHLHIILHGLSPTADLWKAVVDFKQASGYWLSRNMPDVSWQKDFHDHVLRQGDDLAAHVRYVLDNPCRGGLVDRWEDHPFSGSRDCTLEDVLTGLPL